MTQEDNRDADTKLSREVGFHSGKSDRNDEEYVVLEAYRKHVAERANEGVVPKPLDAEQAASLIELIKNPPQGEEAFVLDLLENRIPPGVDEAAYVKPVF